MNILFVGKRHYTRRDALSERYGRIYQLPWHWMRRGRKVQLWLMDYHGYRHRRRMDDGLLVRSFPVLGLRWIGACFSIALARLRGMAPTHVVASGDAYIGMLSWLISRICGAKFVFDIYDRYDVFPGYRKLFGIDSFGVLTRRADRCWFASRWLLERVGSAERDDRVVANGVDLQKFAPMPMHAAREQLGLDVSGCYAGYFGSMDPDRGIEDLIEAVTMLRSGGMDIRVLLAGHAPQAQSLDSEAVRYLGNLPHEQVPVLLNAVDLVVLPYRRSSFLDAAASVKVAEILACGRPIVATRTPNFVENFPDQAKRLDSYLANPSDPRGLALAMQAQLRDRRIVDMPTDMSWECIADSALHDLEQLSTRPARNGSAS